jgi:uncharacterized protein
VSKHDVMSKQSLFPLAEPDSPLVVRMLDDADRPAVDAFLRRDPLRFLSLRVNVEFYGFRSNTLRIWGAVNSHTGEVWGMGLRFSNTLIVADQDGRSAPTFAEWIDQERNLVGLRGTEPTITQIGHSLRRLAPHAREKSLHMILRRPPSCPPEILSMAKRATSDDLDKLTELYSHAGNMYRSRANIESKLRGGRIFIVEESETFERPARVAACALQSAEGTDAGLIGGVFTLPEARGKGYASACTAALSRSLQEAGKMPCLFYENPIAGRVYRKLGFERADQWSVLYLVRRR